MKTDFPSFSSNGFCCEIGLLVLSEVFHWLKIVYSLFKLVKAEVLHHFFAEFHMLIEILNSSW